MNSQRHVLATLLSRFRREIAGFLLLATATACISLLRPAWTEMVAAVEWIAFHWLTLRILLSEEGFRTHGGWRTRPLPRNAVLTAQVILLGSVLAVLLAIHAFISQLLLHPTLDQWRHQAGVLFRSSLMPWLFFAGIVKLFGILLLGRFDGWARKAAWSTLIIALSAFLFLSIRGMGRPPSRIGGTTHDEQKLSAGIQRALPEATEFIGMWHEAVRAYEVPPVRAIFRFPLTPGHAGGSAGIRLVDFKMETHGTRAQIDFTLQAADPTLQELDEATAVLRYADGSCGMGMAAYRMELRNRLPGFAILQQTKGYRYEFPSPLCLPENRNADPATLAPIELIFFVADPDSPPFPTPLDFIQWENKPPSPPQAIPPPASADAFDRAVRELIDSLASEHGTGGESRALAHAAQLPPEAMAPILRYRPWPDHAWTKMISPFLHKHAGEAEKAALLERLAFDPRLTSLFIAKNWTAEAIPVLRQRAKERQPLPMEALELLARQNDPALSEDLAALALRLNRGIEKLAPVLRENTAFDWPAFVAAGWKNRKYGDYDSQGWRYAAWAASLGDASALRCLAEEAAVGKKWERAQLEELIDGKQDDLMVYLRENLDRLHFDPASGKWQP